LWWNSESGKQNAERENNEQSAKPGHGASEYRKQGHSLLETVCTRKRYFAIFSLEAGRKGCKARAGTERVSLYAIYS
jgi:hypothetical protein